MLHREHCIHWYWKGGFIPSYFWLLHFCSSSGSLAYELYRSSIFSSSSLKSKYVNKTYLILNRYQTCPYEYKMSINCRLTRWVFFSNFLTFLFFNKYALYFIPFMEIRPSFLQKSYKDHPINNSIILLNSRKKYPFSFEVFYVLYWTKIHIWIRRDEANFCQNIFRRINLTNQI